MKLLENEALKFLWSS